MNNVTDRAIRRNTVEPDSKVALRIALNAPSDFGQTVNGFQDDFDGGNLNRNWVAVGQSRDIYLVTNGVLRVASAQGDPNHLLYQAPGYSQTVQEVLARIRVRNFQGGDGPRGGLGVAVGSDSQGINYHFRDEGNLGRHTEFLDDLRAWGPEFNFKWQTNAWYWMRLRHEPNTAAGQPDAFAKIWLADGSATEPDSWRTWDYTPSRGTRRGFAGITASSLGGVAEFDVDYILIKAAGLPSIQVGRALPTEPTAPAPKFLSVAVLPSGQIRLLLAGQPGARLVIESSDDLFKWNPISTNVANVAGSLEFTDTAITSSAQRFYRAKSP